MASKKKKKESYKFDDKLHSRERKKKKKVNAEDYLDATESWDASVLSLFAQNSFKNLQELIAVRKSEQRLIKGYMTNAISFIPT